MVAAIQSKFLTGLIVRKDYEYKRKLGSGADGVVKHYTHKRLPNTTIAVKTPSERGRIPMQMELSIMRKIGKSPYIVEMLGYDENWGPAIFYEYCALGDAFSYPQQLRQLYGVVPEETIWKFFSDVAKGLDYLHNALGDSMVHGDLKCENVLVSYPWAMPPNLPVLPTFKIADLSRTAAQSGKSGAPLVFHGTYEYGPP
ncbi:kinase-like protein, partial [Aaosphaeria arxii CBS 175.79]